MNRTMKVGQPVLRIDMSTAKVNSLRTLIALSILVLVVFLNTSLAVAGGLEYSTFLGGNGHDAAEAIDVDSDGNVYVSGETDSSDFPTTPGAVDTSHDESFDAFITKLTADGSALLYSTFVGGSDSELVEDIALDDSGAAYITGKTWSLDFPTTPAAFDGTFNGGYGDVFVARIHSSGAVLHYSTYLGGDDWDDGNSIVLDSDRNAYIAGSTHSSDFPATGGAFDVTKDGSWDAFIAKLNQTGTALSYSTFVGGDRGDFGYSIALDISRNAYVAGATSSSDFPVAVGAYDKTCGNDGNCDFNGSEYFDDAFALRLNSTGTSLSYATFLGGSGLDWGSYLVRDVSGHTYVAGYTESPDFPTTPDAYDTSHNGMGPPWQSDVFITKLSGNGQTLVYSTFLGGLSDDYPFGLGLDALGRAHVTGATRSTDFPSTVAAFDRVPISSDVFLTRLNPSGSALSYSTFLGGSDEEWRGSMLLHSSDAIHLTGRTESADFPTTPGAFDETHNNGGDAFVTKLSIPDISAAVEIVGPEVGPIVVSPGGTLRYEVTLRNNTDSSKSFGAKTYVSGPPTVDPLDGPVPATLGQLASVSRALSKPVPNSAPLGPYNLCVEAFDGSGLLDEDCVEFEIVP